MKLFFNGLHKCVQKMLLLVVSAQFAISLGVDNVSVSGWLERFKYQHNITFARIHGKKADADFKGECEWIRNVLPNEIVGYDRKDFECSQNRFGIQGLAVSNFHLSWYFHGKLPKQHLTALLCVNMDESKKNVCCC